MVRVRSPSYPSYSLDEAVANARKIFEKDRRSPIDRQVVASHLGYKSLNGAADKALATMMQYGLLEKVAKGEVRVSQWAIDIMLPDTPSQRVAALRNAAANPSLFRALNERFPEGPPSNETLRAYLLREEFNDRAIGPIITAYGKTSAYLAQECANENSVPRESEGADSELPDDNKVFGGAKVGDFIQWEIDGVLQMPKPMRVRLVTEDGQWVAVDGSETGIPMSQVILEERATADEAPPPPRFQFEERSARLEKLQAGENEWMRNLVGRETKVRLLVSGGEMGAKEIGKLIKLLEAQRAVLADEDDDDR